MSDTNDGTEVQGTAGESLTSAPNPPKPIEGTPVPLMPKSAEGTLADPNERKKRDLERRKKENESVKRSYKLARKK